MAKVKLTRNELKAQREALTRYTRYLPTLELKKLQLEIERRKIEAQMREVESQISALQDRIAPWQKLFAEKYPKPLDQMVQLKEVVLGEANIAGLFVPVFVKAVFEIEEYDLFLSPPWVDTGIEAIEEMIRLREWLRVLERQREMVTTELRRTTQRINLFKDRLIPECRENIRQIRIRLGDMQAAAVGRAKIAKQKVQKRQEVGENFKRNLP